MRDLLLWTCKKRTSILENPQEPSIIIAFVNYPAFPGILERYTTFERSPDRQRAEIDTREYSCRVTLTLEEAKAVQRRVQRSRASYLPYGRSLLYQLKFRLPVDVSRSRKGPRLLKWKEKLSLGMGNVRRVADQRRVHQIRKERRRNGWARSIRESRKLIRQKRERHGNPGDIVKIERG